MLLLPLITGAIGAVIGAMLMRKRGGNKKDMGQYAAGYGILFCVIGLFIAIFLARQAV